MLIIQSDLLVPDSSPDVRAGQTTKTALYKRATTIDSQHENITAVFLCRLNHHY